MQLLNFLLNLLSASLSYSFAYSNSDCCDAVSMKFRLDGSVFNTSVYKQPLKAGTHYPYVRAGQCFFARMVSTYGWCVRDARLCRPKCYIHLIDF